MAITIFASFVPVGGAEDRVLNILQGMVAPTRGETGCRRYDLYRTSEAPTTYHLIELYDDADAVAAHRASDHYKAYRGNIAELLAEPIAVKVLTGVDVAA